MGRYSDINRGPELKEAYEKMKVWREKSKKEKAALYKANSKPKAKRVKVERVKGYILAFAHNSEKIFYETRILADTQTGVGAATANTARELVEGYFKKTLPTTPADIMALPRPKYTFAKINFYERTETATEAKESRVTETPYLRHESNNVSCPFGRKDANDTYTSVIDEIKAIAAYKTFDNGNNGNNRISFTPEIG